MDNYTQLLEEAAAYGIVVIEKHFKSNAKALIKGDLIAIRKGIATHTEKGCVLVEEIGHHRTSSGNILDQHDIRNRKQELRARKWGYEKLVPLTAIVQAHKRSIINRHELALFLNVTEDFLQSALDYYIEKYGLSVQIDSHTVIFEPLGVLELFDFNC